MYYVLLLSMIFCHIIDDYKLQQGVLVNLKQKSWWKENEPSYQYKFDYLMALLMHSTSWSFMMHLPLIIYVQNANLLLLVTFLTNMIIHFVVDDLKANKRKINLIQDQTIHLVQILITWIIWSIYC